MGHLFSAARLRRSPSFQRLTSNADFLISTWGGTSPRKLSIR